MDNKKVWAPEPTEGYVLAEIVDIGADSATVQPVGGGKQVTFSIFVFFTFSVLFFNLLFLLQFVAPYDRLFPSEEHDKKDVEDNCKFLLL